MLGRAKVGESTMQNLLLALMLITAADLDGIAHAADDVPGTIAVKSQQVFPSSSTPNTSANAPAKNHSPDCNGPRGATASVTALLRRLIRASTSAKEVQYTIPPAPDRSPPPMEPQPCHDYTRFTSRDGHLKRSVGACMIPRMSHRVLHVDVS